MARMLYDTYEEALEFLTQNKGLSPEQARKEFSNFFESLFVREGLWEAEYYVLLKETKKEN